MKKRTVITSIFYKGMERFSVKFIGLVIGVVLARLLTPEIFGQIAIIMVFINLSNVFIHSGFCTSLVQRKDVTDDDYSTALYVCLVLSLILIVILWIIAPFIAVYYDCEEIRLPLRIYSLILPVGAYNSIQLAKAQKEMRFKHMVIVHLICAILSGVLGIAVAYAAPGVWALVVYYASSTFLSALTMMFVTSWHPRLVFSSERAKLLFDFGWKILVSGLLCSIYADIRTLLIGKRFSDADLGFYNKGRQYPDVISNALDVSVQSVMLPTLASVQDNIPALRRMFRRSVTTGAFVVMPVMFCLSAISDTFVYLLLTEKWAECIPYMRILCIADALTPILTANLISIKALGRSDIYMRLEMVRRVVMIVILCIAVFAFHSVEIIAYSYLLSFILDILIVMVPIKKLLDQGILEQFKLLWKTIVASVLTGMIVYFFGKISIPMLFVKLMLQGITGILAYVALSFLLRNEQLFYMLNMLKNLVKKRSDGQ